MTSIEQVKDLRSPIPRNDWKEHSTTIKTENRAIKKSTKKMMQTKQSWMIILHG